MRILGININHTSTAALLVDGQIMAAAPEERFVRRKLTREFPQKAIEYVLRSQGLDLEDIDAITIPWNPAINMDMFRRGFSHTYYRWAPEILYAIPNNLFRMSPPPGHEYLHQEIVFAGKKKMSLYYVNHHMSHAALAYYLSGFNRAAVLSVDGFGERACVLWGRAAGNKIKGLQEQHFPHSLGSFYETVTEFLGFTPDSDEWKVMGMAAYGKASRYKAQFEKLVRFLPRGRMELDLSYFNHFNFDQPGLSNRKMEDLFGPKRGRDEDLTERHFDIATGAQWMFEKMLFHCLDHLHKTTQESNLCFSGGSAMNCLANGQIIGRSPFKRLSISYAPDDAGLAIGSALYLYHDILGHRKNPKIDRTSYLGPGYSNAEIEKALERYGMDYRRSPDICEETVSHIEAGRVVAWYQGRMEFGSRALGNRSILADPRRADMKDIINMKVKYRETFRPFAPAVLAERAEEFFAIADGDQVDYMEKVYPIRKAKQALIPAVVHQDGTGRLQTVHRKDNPRYYDVIRAFGRRTGVPILINTSFNIKGEPIVCTPEDAIRTFHTSGLDVLVMGDFIIEKKAHARAAREGVERRHKVVA
ncbi:MAG: carbamoyl transferase [Elusimicrobia bacterium]|nr:carbamoyl transferase [Elusimicrobiota bacterium]